MSRLQVTRILNRNAAWAQGVSGPGQNPDFFSHTGPPAPQRPSVVWIGCSDSRVPPNVITASIPGEIFEHRNIANLVHEDDFNLESVLFYAINVLKVNHVVIVGHSDCGGAQACLAAAKDLCPDFDDVATIPDQPLDAPINRWLLPLTQLAVDIRVSTLPVELAEATLVDANVRRQAQNLEELEVIKDANSEGRDIQIHALVYDVGSGFLRDLNEDLISPFSATKDKD